MLRVLLAITIFLISYLCSSTSYLVPLGPVEPPYFRLQRHCQQEISKESTIGAAIAVVENGEIAFIKSFGFLKKNEPLLVNNDTVFQVGSTSKPFSASLFAIALKQKLINLDTPVKLTTRGPQIVKARHILSHTSGFSRNSWNFHIENSNISRSQLLNLFSKKSQEIPGKIFDYHNVAFSLIEELLQNAFGMPFERAMEEKLLKPLDMARTTIGFHKFKQQSNRAWPHERSKNGKFSPSNEYSYRYHNLVASSAGMNASINDMAKFLKLQLGHFPQVINQNDLMLLHSPVCSAPDAVRWFRNRIKRDFSCHYGYGWRILIHGNEKIVFHGGWLKGFASLIAFSSTRNKGIVVLSNTESSFAFSTAIDFLMNTLI